MDPSKFVEHEAIEPERPNQQSTNSLCEPTRTSAIADEDGSVRDDEDEDWTPEQPSEHVHEERGSK
eukprot:3000033-Prymnesium_polylepis.1